MEVGASYLTPPNDVKRAIHDAIANAPLAMTSPEPQVRDQGLRRLVDRLPGAVLDRGLRRAIAARSDQVRTNIWYEFRRRNIEIPWPIQIQYERDEAAGAHAIATSTPPAEQLGVDRSVLDADAGSAARAGRAPPGPPVRRGRGHRPPGRRGRFDVRRPRAASVRVTLEPSGQEVAVIAAGGFFGEMSMLTGEPRTATVRAVDDVRVLEIGAAAFTQLAVAEPRLLDHVTTVISSRQAGLDQARAAAVAAVVPARAAVAAGADAELLEGLSAEGRQRGDLHPGAVAHRAVGRHRLWRTRPPMSGSLKLSFSVSRCPASRYWKVGLRARSPRFVPAGERMQLSDFRHRLAIVEPLVGCLAAVAIEETHRNTPPRLIGHFQFEAVVVALTAHPQLRAFAETPALVRTGRSRWARTPTRRRCCCGQWPQPVSRQSRIRPYSSGEIQGIRGARVEDGGLRPMLLKSI